MEEGNALPRDASVCRRRPDAVEGVPCETPSSSMVGADRGETLGQLEDHIKNDGVGIIGIYGMGGVGKTTLLKIINNEFLQGEGRGRLFDIAIWVTVSKDVKILEIQKTIVDRLGLPLSDNEQPEGGRSRLVEQQANKIFNELSKKRFILLLDDVWQKLDLLEIGIPLPKNAKINCKILFTTRSEEVCNEMDTDKTVKVSALDAQSSWELFQSKLRSEAVLNDPDIRQLAEQVVARCGGLPISLITVGRAMANATTEPVWRHAKNALDHWATELSGVEDMLASLKFSYDMLKDDTLQSCLLYCGLFPEDYDIPKGEIIDYWVGEGFLDPEHGQDSHIDHTRDRGHRRIRDLQNACLLEEGDVDLDGEGTVRLHNTVLDMVQWITKQDFVVLSGSTNTARVPQPRRWETAKRISLRGRNWTEALPSEKLNCPNLTTLLLPDLPSEDTKGFFEFMSPALRVLVLRGFSFKKIPMQITSLVQLQYLNLSWTKTTSLPTELGDLVNLRQLELRYTSSLRSIPRKAISRLTRLQVLNLKESGYDFSRETRHGQLGLSDLEKLRRLCELSVPVRSWPSLQKIADSNMLRASVIRMNLESDSGFPSGDIVAEKIGNLSSLRELWLSGDPENPVLGELRFRPDQLQGGSLFPKVRHLHIRGVHGFTELTWVGQLRRLETIDIADCDGVTELPLHGAGLPHDGSTPPFPKLKTMRLRVLPALRRISTCPLDFPSLEEIWVMGCPHLKQLPFGPEGAKKIRRIKGDQEWWDGLEWDNYPDGTSIKHKFLPYFKAWGC